MDARITKQPVGQQLHTTAGLTITRSNMASGDGNVFITAQCHIKSTSAKDQKTTDPSCGQWGSPGLDMPICWVSSLFSFFIWSKFDPLPKIAEVLDEYLATLNVRWSNDKGMALIMSVFFTLFSWII